MLIRTFQTSDLPEYQSWFTDPLINQHLGPAPDQEWLDCGLQDTENTYYAAIVNDELLGVAIITLPTEHNPYFVVSELCTHPHRRRRGIAKAFLSGLMQICTKDKETDWIAWVASANHPAQYLLEDSGWNSDLKVDEEGMLCYHYTLKTLGE